MLENIPIRATGSWTMEDKNIIIKNLNRKIILNSKQSYIWEHINGIDSEDVLIQKICESEMGIDRSTIIDFINSAISLGIIFYSRDEEWDCE